MDSQQIELVLIEIDSFSFVALPEKKKNILVAYLRLTIAHEQMELRTSPTRFRNLNNSFYTMFSECRWGAMEQSTGVFSDVK